MCTNGCLEFLHSQLDRRDLTSHRILEVGSLDVNGTGRLIVGRPAGAEYIGVDVRPGPGVDEVVPVERLVERFGPESFDLVITTEMLEHVPDWRRAIHNLKAVARPGGLLLVTTRARGFPLHGFPLDFWRYELDDFREIFADLEIDALESDVPGSPGVMLAARKPLDFRQCDLSEMHLYSIVRRRRARRATFLDRALSATLIVGKRGLSRVVPKAARTAGRRVPH